MSKGWKIAGLISLVLGANGFIAKPIVDDFYKPSTKSGITAKEIIYDGTSALLLVGGIILYGANSEKRKNYREDWNKF